jgi:hypothetical protein
MDDIGRDALYRSLPLGHLRRLRAAMDAQAERGTSGFGATDRLRVVWTRDLRADAPAVVAAVETWLGVDAPTRRAADDVLASCVPTCVRDLGGLHTRLIWHRGEAAALGLGTPASERRYAPLEASARGRWSRFFEPYDATLLDWLGERPELVLHAQKRGEEEALEE